MWRIWINSWIQVNSHLPKFFPGLLRRIAQIRVRQSAPAFVIPEHGLLRRKRTKFMIKAIIRLIIASASLWVALPAAAQFEIDPDHFGDPVVTVVQPRPEQSKGSMRTLLGTTRVQQRRVPAFTRTKNRASASRTLSSVEGIQHREVYGASRGTRGPVDRKENEQSRIATTHRPYQTALH